MEKWCDECCEYKSDDEFHKNARVCKPCLNERHREYYKKNRDKIAATQREWRKRHKHQRKAYNKKQSAKYYRENKAAVLLRCRNRDKRIIDRTPTHWAGWDDMFMRIKGMYKAADAIGPGNHVDHIIPLNGTNVSGLHVPDNLRIISAFENLSKGNQYTP